MEIGDIFVANDKGADRELQTFTAFGNLKINFIFILIWSIFLGILETFLDDQKITKNIEIVYQNRYKYSIKVVGYGGDI